MNNLKIGTCSWKYDSWKGIVYPEFGDFNYLEEYSKKYNTVEIDQWFWSLFPNNKVTLPKKNIVEDYNNSTPDDFKFTIKVPNSITLTHPYKSKQPNKHFLSFDLFEAFLDSIEKIKPKVGMLMFQFEYLNKTKMNSQMDFQFMLEEFFSQVSRDWNYAVEIRNPNYLNDIWFAFLSNHDIAHVFLQGYYMPRIYETFEKFTPYFKNSLVIRLHGFDRKGIELKTNKVWNEIVDTQEDLAKILEMINVLLDSKIDLYLNVNNHFEGSAPLTIERIKSLLKNK